MTPAPILVIGSVMIDRVCTVPSLPTRGSTVLGTHLAKHLGGKGLNQAMQVHRLGGAVTFVGAIGDDDDAQWVLETLASDGFPTTHLHRLDGPTGQALICVDPAGENQIAVAPGANLALNSAHALAALDSLDRPGYIVASLEVPLATLTALFEAARERGHTIIVNAAPWQPAPARWYEIVDGWIFNEAESRGCFQMSVIPEDHPIARHASWVVITRGADGADLWITAQMFHVEHFQVHAIDTVGAGDAFVGAFVSELARGITPLDALRTANAAGALACTIPGAIPSLPTRARLEAFLDDSI